MSTGFSAVQVERIKHFEGSTSLFSLKELKVVYSLSFNVKLSSIVDRFPWYHEIFMCVCC